MSNTDEFYIDSDFVSRTDQFLKDTKPFMGLSPSGFITDFLGIHTSTDYFKLYNTNTNEKNKKAQIVKTSSLTLSAGELYFELGSLVAAVEEAQNTFYMMELGGGWGARTVIANAVLNRINPIDEFYIVVEGMKKHCSWVKEHMENNGVNSKLHSIIHSVVWVDNQPQLFPSCQGVFGQSVAVDIPNIVSNLTDHQSKKALKNLVKKGSFGISDEFQANFGKHSRDWKFVSAITLRDILLPRNQVDYVDMDIQGAELQVLENEIDLIDEKVKRIHIGTHGKDIHKELINLFEHRGWQILIQAPPNGQYSTQWGEFKTGDGILSMFNQKMKYSS